MKNKKFLIPVKWEMSGDIEVEAKDLKEAVQKAWGRWYEEQEALLHPDNCYQHVTQETFQVDHDVLWDHMALCEFKDYFGDDEDEDE